VAIDYFDANTFKSINEKDFEWYNKTVNDRKQASTFADNIK
jgi:hypothetical protein